MRLLAPILVAGFILAGCAGPTQTADPVAQAPAPPVPPGNYTFDAFARVLEPGPLGVLPFQKTYLASGVGGVDIEVGLWLPDTDEPVPVIVDAGPYYGNNGPIMDRASGHLNRLITNFVPHGFAVAAVAVRGTGGSGGCMDLMGPQEVADLDQAITWLATQPWSNGNAAMIGKSYDGSTPWMVASTGNPHLKTIVPISGVPDIYELMFRNGTAEIRGPFLLNALYYSFAVREQAPPPATVEEAVRAATHTLEAMACPDHAAGLGAALYSGIEGGRDPTGYWAPRNLKPGVEANYRGSILHVQGLQDWNVDPGLNLPWVDELNKSGIFVHHMLGQWGHSYPDDANSGPNARWDWAQILLHWFDRWLRDNETAPLGPAVQVLDNEGRWRVEDHWPPRDAAHTRLWLAADGALVDGEAAAGEFLLLPQAVSPAMLPAQPPTVPGASADFRLKVPGETLIAGLPLVHVTVVPDAPGGTLAAYLYADGPDGTRRIGHTQINLRFADGTQEPKDVTPGQPLRVKMQIQPMDGVVEAGEDLLLRIWAYRDEANGDNVQGRLPSIAPGSMTLRVGGTSDSFLQVPIIERAPSVYFTPPQDGA